MEANEDTFSDLSLVLEHKIHYFQIESMLLLRDGEHLVLGTKIGKIFLFEIKGNSTLMEKDGYDFQRDDKIPNSIYTMIELPNQQIACVSILGTIYILETYPRMTQILSWGVKDSIYSLAYMHYNLLCVANLDFTIDIFELNNKNVYPYRTITKPSFIPNSLSTISDNLLAICWNSNDKSILGLYDRQRDQTREIPLRGKCVSSDGLYYIRNVNCLAIGYDDENSKGGVMLYDLSTDCFYQIRDDANVIRCCDPMKFTSFGKLLLHARIGNLTLIDIKSKNIVKHFKFRDTFVGKLLGVSKKIFIITDNERKEESKETMMNGKKRKVLMQGISIFEIKN